MNDLLADYRHRGWSLVPIPIGRKGPITADWPLRNWRPGDFQPGGNVGVILGPRSGELVDSHSSGPYQGAVALQLAPH